MKQRRLSILCIALVFSVLLPLTAATTLPLDRIEITGELPVTQIFRVEQNPFALSFNLVESRNSIVSVGSYVLISNSGNAKFSLVIKPGEAGDADQFAFTLDDVEANVAGKETVLPFGIRVTSRTADAISVAGTRAMQKELGVPGGLSSNQAIVYEDGEILAEIPNFDPDEYAAGHYSAALQLSIEAL
ncbi:MAG TPA: hypothetical protein VFC80_03575 [Sphaerochaeta sp.]|nr:hypothetical protein [Sphaerochaeta sp.]